MPTVPAKLMRTLALSAILIVIGNPLADRVGLKYWLAGIKGASARVFAHLQSGAPADLVILGSSRSVLGVSPLILEEEYRLATQHDISTYNLAMKSARIVTSSIVLRDVVGANGCPEIVLLELSPRTLDSGAGYPESVLEFHASLGDTAAALPYLRRVSAFNAAGWGLLRGYLNMVLWVSHRPWSDPWRGILAHWVSNRGDGPPESDDSRSTVESMTGWSRQERSRRLGRTQLGKRAVESPDLTYHGFTTRALEEVLESARHCGCRVVVWTPPTISDYTALYRPTERQRFDEVLSELADRDGVEVFDVGDGRLGLGDADFVDFTHLNSRGAVKLSRALARMIAGGPSGSS